MREIKFRGYNGLEWLYTEMIRYVSEDDSWQMMNHETDEWDYVSFIGQYTGALDKKGKEIYEGDIVNCSEYGCYGKIYWDEELFSFMFATLCEDGTLFNERFYDYVNDMEIIGNIYENPELLEVK